MHVLPGSVLWSLEPQLPVQTIEHRITCAMWQVSYLVPKYEWELRTSWNEIFSPQFEQDFYPNHVTIPSIYLSDTTTECTPWHEALTTYSVAQHRHTKKMGMFDFPTSMVMVVSSILYSLIVTGLMHWWVMKQVEWRRDEAELSWVSEIWEFTLFDEMLFTSRYCH